MRVCHNRVTLLDTHTTMDHNTVSQLSERLHQQVAAYKPGNESQRQKMLQSTTELIRAIETPSERIARMCYPDIYVFLAVRILVDLDVFRIISKENSAVTVSQLAKKTGADGELLGRLLKHVCTQGFVQEVGPDEYAANGVTDKVA